MLRPAEAALFSGVPARRLCGANHYSVSALEEVMTLRFPDISRDSFGPHLECPS